MGSGSDFTAFQDFAGIPSLDMGFSAAKNSPIYQYHSNYDSFSWMERFGDPSFEYHATIAKVWALLAAKLVEMPVLPMSAKDYALGLRKYIDDVKDLVSETGFPNSTLTASNSRDDKDPFTDLDQAISHFLAVSIEHDAHAAALTSRLADIDDIPWWKFWKRIQLFAAIRKTNTKYKLLERQFLYSKGLDGRPWFKHVVFAPGKWTGYSGATFPGLVEGIQDKDAEVVRRWVGIVSRKVHGAAGWLKE